MPVRPFAPGCARPLDAAATTQPTPLTLPAHHFVTHGVIVGMTGSGKTGLGIVLVEEALRSKIPVLMVDVKGDLPNLLLMFPELSGAEFEPWIDPDAAARDETTTSAMAERIATRWRTGLASWGLGARDVAGLRNSIAPRVITPGSTAAESLHVLSSLETPSPLWQTDEEGARESLSASLSLLLRLIGREADPARSKEHVVLAHLAERRLRNGQSAGIAALLGDLAEPPVREIGALPLEEFLPKKERQSLAQDMNTILASPTFASWRQGSPLDVGAWLRPRDGKTPAVIVSVAHLGDEERALVLGLLLEELLSWVRGLPGTSELRALVVFDEVFGFMPPHPANPPTKKPLLALMKQARAFGVGVLLATQNPMDLDYKALSNAGIWFVGRLQTDADRERVVDGLSGSDAGTMGLDPRQIAGVIKSLPPRTFFVRDVHGQPASMLVESRWSLSWLRGPMTRQEIKRALPSPPKPAVAQPIAPERESSPTRNAASTMEASDDALLDAPPAPPEGWREWHVRAAESATGTACAPWVTATVSVLLRDAKLGLNATRKATIAAPLTAEGRVDSSRAVIVREETLQREPMEGARYRPLPDVFEKKTGVAAAERAMRDAAVRLQTVTVAVHAGLALAQGETEPMASFAARVVAEAQRAASIESHDVTARFAPKVQRAQAKLAAANAAVAMARAAADEAPGAVGTVLIGALAGARAAQRAVSQREKRFEKLEKAQRAEADAEAALREVLAERDARIAELLRDATRAADQIEQRVIAPKKTDIDVVEIGIAWVR
jgi:hypothetical protein